MDIRTYHASDYIGGLIGEFSFYYGYEVSKCTKCGKMTNEYCDECDDADRDWCFQVKEKGEAVFTRTCKELGAKDMSVLSDCFIRGMMLFATTEGKT